MRTKTRQTDPAHRDIDSAVAALHAARSSHDRELAVLHLARLQSSDPPVIGALAEALDINDPDVCRTAAEALVSKGFGDLVLGWCEQTSKSAGASGRRFLKKLLRSTLTDRSYSSSLPKLAHRSSPPGLGDREGTSAKEDRMSPASSAQDPSGISQPTIQELREALKASYHSMTPQEHFQRMVRNGLIDSAGRLTKLFGGDAEMEPGAHRPGASNENGSEVER